MLKRVEALQVKNKLLCEENLGLQEALNTRKRHKKKRNTLTFNSAKNIIVVQCSSLLQSSAKPRLASV